MKVDARSASLAEINYQAWRLGVAESRLLDRNQQEWVRLFWSGEPIPAVWNIGRQVGKTYAAILMAFAFACRTRGAIIRYCARTKDSAIAIVEPTMRQIIPTMPPEFRPVKGRNEFEWVFPHTDSSFVVFGTDAQSFSRGRGPRTHLQLFDEYAFFQNLEDVEAALLPSLQTTGGRVLYLSSPPESLGHPAATRIRSAAAAGRLSQGTFWDNPRVNHEKIIASEMSRLGLTREQLLKSSQFRREYLAELVAEENKAALPAWTQERAATLVQEFTKPKHFDAYEALDLGFAPDPSAALFAYFDFASQTVFVVDEVEVRGEGVKALAEAFKAKEAELWGANKWDGTLLSLAEESDLPAYLQNRLHRLAPSQPFSRVGDHNLIVLSELASVHGVAISPARKDDKHLAVDAVNELIIQGRLKVHPRCARLITQMFTTVWNNSRTQWERTAQDHGDLVDCLIYLCRSIRWHKDARPKRHTVDEFIDGAGGSGWRGVFTR